MRSQAPEFSENLFVLTQLYRVLLLLHVTVNWSPICPSGVYYQPQYFLPSSHRYAKHSIIPPTPFPRHPRSFHPRSFHRHGQLHHHLSCSYFRSSFSCLDVQTLQEGEYLDVYRQAVPLLGSVCPACNSGA